MAEEQNKEMKQFPLDNISSIDWAKTCMKAFFEIIFKVWLENNQLEETVMDQDAKIQEYIWELKVLWDSKWLLEQNFNREIEK